MRRSFYLLLLSLNLACPGPAPLQGQQLRDAAATDSGERRSWDVGAKPDLGPILDAGSAVDSGLLLDLGPEAGSGADGGGISLDIGLDASPDLGPPPVVDAGAPAPPDAGPPPAPDAGPQWGCGDLPMACPDPQADLHRMVTTVGCRFALNPPDWDAGDEVVDRLVRAVGNTRSVAQVLGDLNRVGRSLGGWYLGRSIDGAQGFRWNSGDDNVSYWMPQGITGSSDAYASGRVGNRKVIAMSWYDNGDGQGANRGVRVSFADVTNLGAVRYRHALLVEPMDNAIVNFRAVESHAGGMVWYGRYLYVAQTHEGFRVFDMNKIMQVETDRDVLGYDDGRYYARRYKFIIPQVGSYSLQQESCRVKFSFVSLDRSHEPHQLTSGEYHASSDDGLLVHWNLNPANHRLELRQGHARGRRAAIAGETKMQGALTYNGRWYLSSSSQFLRYGKLYSTEPGGGAPDERAWPYGPEDLYLDRQTDRLWTCTEFAGYRKVMNLRRAP